MCGAFCLKPRNFAGQKREMESGKSITKEFLKLPERIRHDGAFFTLYIAPGNRDLIFAYRLEDVLESSPRHLEWEEYGGWSNPFDNGKLQGFLWMREGIKSDDDLLEAIETAHGFLTKNGLI